MEFTSILAIFITNTFLVECMRQTTKLNKMNIHFVGGASCVDKNQSGECSNIHPYPDGGENGSKGKAPPVPVGDSQSQPGTGTWEDLRGYRMKNFVLAPGKGGKTENKTFSLNGGGGGGVLINGVGPTLSLLENPTNHAPTKLALMTTPNTNPTPPAIGKNTTTTSQKTSASTSPNKLSNNGQGYGGGQGGSQNGSPGPGVVLLEVIALGIITSFELHTFYLSLPFHFLACMEGFHLVPGDIAGLGDLGHLNNISDTEICGMLCLNSTGCKSYEFSRTENWCNLNSADTPNEPEFIDQAFCVKTGAVPKYILHTFSKEFVDSYIWKSGICPKDWFLGHVLVFFCC